MEYALLALSQPLKFSAIRSTAGLAQTSADVSSRKSTAHNAPAFSAALNAFFGLTRVVDFSASVTPIPKIRTELVHVNLIALSKKIIPMIHR
jgi:hypothetical protein